MVLACLLMVFLPDWICAKLPHLLQFDPGSVLKVDTQLPATFSWHVPKCICSIPDCLQYFLIWSFQNVMLTRPACPQAVLPLHHLRAPTVSGQVSSVEENMNWHCLSWTKLQYWNDDCKSSVSKSSVLLKPLWIFDWSKVVIHQGWSHKYSLFTLTY